MTTHAKRAESARTSILSFGVSFGSAFTVLHGATAVSALMLSIWALLGAANAAYTLVLAGRTRRWSPPTLAASWVFVATVTVAATTFAAMSLSAALG